MTNEEKARLIAEQWGNGGVYTQSKISAREMADWKDQQFKEYLDKKKDALANYHKIWLPDEKSRLCYREKVDLIDEILSELFPEQDKNK